MSLAKASARLKFCMAMTAGRSIADRSSQGLLDIKEHRLHKLRKSRSNPRGRSQRLSVWFKYTRVHTG